MSPIPTWLPLAAFSILVVSSLVRLAGLRRVGVNAFTVRAGDDNYAFLGRVFGVMFAATFIFCFAYAVRPTVAGVLGPLGWLGQDIAGWIGAAFAVVGALLAAAAQFGMGRSWRIGVREGDSSELVNSGLYRLSRNPIYVGMMGVMIGIFLMAPNAVTLVLAVVAWITVSAQIRLEEDFLSRKHGDAYDTYRAQTRRWL